MYILSSMNNNVITSLQITDGADGNESNAINASWLTGPLTSTIYQIEMRAPQLRHRRTPVVYHIKLMDL